jgi:murein DD-endopeptidase MepM/ murein hydrolase activator NlpD
MARRRFVVLSSCFAVLALSAGPLAPPAPAQSQPPQTVPQAEYQPPVSGPVVDGWRPPPGPYSAGNRGIDYATTPGQPVGAPGSGVVSFAGSVAGLTWVVVRHRDGRRSSVGPIGTIAVKTGEQVTMGQSVGTAAGTVVHWGVREADVYIDPGTLLPGEKGRLRLTK